MIKIIGAEWCAFCKKAKEHLDNLGVDYEWQDLDQSAEARQVLMDHEVLTVPFIFDDECEIGGYNDLVRYLDSNA